LAASWSSAGAPVGFDTQVKAELCVAAGSVEVPAGTKIEFKWSFGEDLTFPAEHTPFSNPQASGDPTLTKNQACLGECDLPARL